MSFIFSVIKWLLALAVVLGVSIWAFMQFHPVFGGKPDAESLAKIHASKNFDKAAQIFVNLEETPIQTAEEPITIPQWIWKTLNPPEGKKPTEPLPTVQLDNSKWRNGSVAWLGHSSTIFQTNGKRFITDPVFHQASPVPLIMEPFAMTHPPTLDQLPEIDVVLISHDHYDHLDYRTIQALKDKVAKFVVPLGVKAHLQRWGLENEKIVELDWDEKTVIDGVEIILVPARHFSGRSFDNQFSTLWGGYVVKSADLSLYFSADSGYGSHYSERVAQYAPFDFAMVENGAYNTRWSLIHEFPEQAVQAAKDVQAVRVMPIHWGKFDLAEHQWKEPIERFLAQSEKDGIQTTTPKIGEVFNIFEDLPQEKWWESVK